MGFVSNLRCRECGAEYDVSPVYLCSRCLGPLEVSYDYEQASECFVPSKIAQGPFSMWRYKCLLPVDGDTIIDFGTGFTPLVKADRLGRVLGLKHLYLKNDCVNPTYSFKDRVVSVAVTKALEFGLDTVACASTGNLAASLAAFAARAGLRCFILVPADIEPTKMTNILVHGAAVITVKGNYDQVNRLCTQLVDCYGWGFVNINLRPFYSEGSKTLAYETAEQLGWRLPDSVVVPIAGGSVLSKITKGFKELINIGLLDGPTPRVFGAQAEGCAPVSRAFKADRSYIEPVKPNTIARSLAIGSPADGAYALASIRDTGGAAEDVTDEEIVEGIKLLASTEGVFAETAGGVTVGVLKKLAEKGLLDKDEIVVAYITGSGLKTVEALEGRLAAPVVIDPTLEAFEESLLARATEISTDDVQRVAV